MSRITKIEAMTIFDSRSVPTIEVEVTLENGIVERASVPSGASKGTREAIELRDGDENRFLGKGVEKAISNVNKIIFPEIVNMEITEQKAIDEKMIALDGTENKGKLGANAILGVSLAVAKAAAATLGIPLYRYIARLYGEPNPHILPVPMLNIVSGGDVAKNNLSFQSIMIIPFNSKKFSESMRMGMEVYHNINRILKERGYNFGIGDEGGFSPLLQFEKEIERVKEAISIILDGIKMAHYNPGEDILLALDPSASKFYKNGMYEIGDEQKTSKEMVEFYNSLVDTYPIISIEDGMAEKDEEGWKLLTAELGNKIQLVGDDLFVTNPKIFQQGIEKGLANSLQVMPIQIGSLSETLETIKMARASGYSVIVSHRSGETEDTTISDLTVGCNIGQIKAGGLSRTDRVAKYNQLIRIEEELGDKGLFIDSRIFDQKIIYGYV